MKHSSEFTAHVAALLCLCLGINALENVLLPLIAIPVPGIKLGLSNLVILFSIAKGDRGIPWVLVLLRSTVSALLFGTPVTFLFSVTGGILSLVAMLFAFPLVKKGFSFVSVSVAGSFAFQIGQSTAAVLLYGKAILYYTPFLLLCGVFTGSLLGFILNLTLPRLKKISFLRA